MQSVVTKIEFFKFFYLFPHKHLQILTIPKLPEFSTKCASRSNSGGPERSRGIYLLRRVSFLSRRSLGEGGCRNGTPLRGIFNINIQYSIVNRKSGGFTMSTEAQILADCIELYAILFTIHYSPFTIHELCKTNPIY